MTTISSMTLRLTLVLLALGMAGCAGMTNRERNTAMGAGVGAVAGSVLTGGSAIGTVGGAAIGGLIMNGTTDKRKK